MRRDERGAAMVEFAIVFPLQLFVVLGLLQVALMFGANQVVHYSAYSAARAAIPDRSEEDVQLGDQEAAEKAAQVANLAITWAPLSRATDRESFLSDVQAQAVAQHEAAKGLTVLRGDPGRLIARYDNSVTCNVQHHYEMLIPGIAQFLTGEGGFNFLIGDDPTDANSSMEGG